MTEARQTYKTKIGSIITWVRHKADTAFKTADSVMRHKGTEIIEYELEELNNIFGILILGSFIGIIPAPPIHITMDLLPLLDNELKIMLEKVSTAHDPLGDLFSVLPID
jgi:hypothetical protein